MSKICSVWTAGDFNAKECIGYSFSLGIKALGYEIDQHYPALLAPYSPPFCHLVISNGLRSPAKETSEFLKSRGVDTLVYDLGYINRSDTKNKTGYYQLGLNRIGWTPDFKCPSDRFERLGVEIPEVKDNGSDVVLVCAQKFNDAQHRMGPGQMMQYMSDLCKKVKNMGYHVVFRSHPKSPFKVDVPGVEYSNPSQRSFREEAERARFVVTYNSTCGVESLLYGTPVVPMSDDAHYKPVSSEGVGPDQPLDLPTRDQLEDYFYKLAYSQWKLEEYADGYPYKFLLAVIDGKNPFDEYPEEDWTKNQPWEKPAEKAEENTKVMSREYEISQGAELTVEGLSWQAARSHVKTVTGTWPKSKAHMQEIVEEWNAKV